MSLFDLRIHSCSFDPSEWAINQHRDTMASHIGHYDFLSYCALVENEAVGRVKYTMLEVRFFIIASCVRSHFTP
jgi:hypothetical protein